MSYHNGNCLRLEKKWKPLLILLYQPIPHAHLHKSICWTTGGSEIPRKCLFNLPVRWWHQTFTCRPVCSVQAPEDNSFALAFPVASGQWPLVTQLQWVWEFCLAAYPSTCYSYILTLKPQLRQSCPPCLLESSLFPLWLLNEVYIMRTIVIQSFTLWGCRAKPRNLCMLSKYH